MEYHVVRLSDILYFRAQYLHIVFVSTNMALIKVHFNKQLIFLFILYYYQACAAVSSGSRRLSLASMSFKKRYSCVIHLTMHPENRQCYYSNLLSKWSNSPVQFPRQKYLTSAKFQIFNFNGKFSTIFRKIRKLRSQIFLKGQNKPVKWWGH